MHPFASSSLITGVLSLLLAAFVFLRKGNLSLNKLWAATSFFIAFWSFGLFGVTFFSDYKYAYASQIILDISAIFVPVLFLDFVVTLIEKKDKYKSFIRLCYFFAVLLAVFSVTPLFKKGLKAVFDFEYWIDPGSLYYIFPTFFMALAIVATLFLIKGRKEFSGAKKQQIRYVLYSAFIGFGGGLFNFLPQFSQIYPIGNYLVGFYAAAITYAIVKYRLMNIRLILTRSILYGVLVGAVASFFALSVLIVGNAIGGNSQTSKIVTYVINSLIVVIFLEPVKRVWAKITDRIFYKDKINYQEALQDVGVVLAREIDLLKLLHSTVVLLAKKIKIKEVLVFIPDKAGFHLLASSDKEAREVSLSGEFVSYLEEQTEAVVIEELIRDVENNRNSHEGTVNRFIEVAEKLKVEVVIPVIEQEKMTAVFLLKAKHSGDLYSNEDINFFKVLIPQVATAIEKSKLYEEVEEFNRELQAKVEERTKSLQQANLTLEERNKSLTTMQVISNMVTRTLDLKKVNQMIADSIATELGYVGGMLSFVDSKNKKLLKVGALTNNEKTREAFRLLKKEPREYATELVENFNLGAQTALTGKINFSDKLSDFLAPPVDKETLDIIQEKLGIKTAVGVPIFSEAKIIGVIHFYLQMKREDISSMDIEMMNAITNHVGIVSRNLQLYNTLQKANKDLQDANMRLRELDKAKSEFLSIASHQLRTPISAIKGYLSMMIDGDFGKVPKNIQEVIKNLFESSARLARLINIFLNVSRIESGRLKLEKKPIQISELIDSVIVELINQAKQKGVKLEYKKTKKAPPLIYADADKLREVILNLIDNAIKYTPEGSIVVSVSANDKELTFRTEDTGIGIKKEEVKSLFRKFVRGSGVAQVHTGGSGLGLFIAQKIIKEHNGKVWAESEGKGKGSVFQFVVPVYDGHEVPAYKKEAEEKEQENK